MLYFSHCGGCMLYYRTRYYTLPHIQVVLQSFNKLAMRVSSWSQSKKKKKKKSAEMEFKAQSSANRKSLMVSVLTLVFALSLLRLKMEPSIQCLMPMPVSVSAKASVNIAETIRLNNIGAKIRPCFTPFDTRNGSDEFPSS